MTFSPARIFGTGRWLAVAMLVTLHFALWSGVDSIWSRPLLFVHLGFFLLWQPLWRGEERLRTGRAVIIVGVSILALLWLNWWVLAFWVSGLFSLVGGRVFAFQGASQRLRYLLSMGYLLAVLLFWVAPQLFGLPTASEASRSLMEKVLPLLLLGIALVPYQSERLTKTVAIDLVYSILLFMLLAQLVLGSLAFMTLGHVDYFQGLLNTLFMMALLLFVLGWLWNPRLGFSGFQAIFSRYFLNVGTPFELWLKQLAKTAQQEPSPATFLKIATGHLAELPWLSGLSWESDEGHGRQGANSPHNIDIFDHDLRLVLFTRHRVSPTVLMHIRLLSQLLANFYQSKRREQRLREMVRLQAVHETGARLTHDLKNMLQSLLALISIAEQRPSQAQPILQHQLPMLVQRIELTLGKLKVPKYEADAAMMPLSTWWNSLQQRQQYRNLEWLGADGLAERQIPFTLFDSIADNLIDNARTKRLREPGITVHISLRIQPLCLSVCDSGSEIPEKVAGQLLRTVVESEDGLGVGLFQAARWAEQTGYRLLLQENRKGRVCFELVEIIENFAS
jgi:signal transduction histidine kinase